MSSKKWKKMVMNKTSWVKIKGWAPLTQVSSHAVELAFRGTLLWILIHNLSLLLHLSNVPYQCTSHRRFSHSQHLTRQAPFMSQSLLKMCATPASRQTMNVQEDLPLPQALLSNNLNCRDHPSYLRSKPLPPLLLSKAVDRRIVNMHTSSPKLPRTWLQTRINSRKTTTVQLSSLQLRKLKNKTPQATILSSTTCLCIKNNKDRTLLSDWATTISRTWSCKSSLETVLSVWLRNSLACIPNNINSSRWSPTHQASSQATSTQCNQWAVALSSNSRCRSNSNSNSNYSYSLPVRSLD